MPTIPPQQTFIPASRTACSVSSRSWYVRSCDFLVVAGRRIEIVIVVVRGPRLSAPALFGRHHPEVAQVSIPNDFTSRIIASTLRRSFGLGER